MASTERSPSAAAASGRGGRRPAEGDDDSTLAPVRDAGEIRRSSRARSAGVVLLWLVVLAGAVGLLGVHSSTARASGSGYRAELTYASIARPGWDVPWHLVVTHPGGFGEGTVTVAVSRSMFDIYETQGFHPEPDSETADGQYLYLEFAPPPGDTLVVDFDAYIQPTSQLGRRTTVKVVTGGQERLQLHTRTFLLP